MLYMGSNWLQRMAVMQHQGCKLLLKPKEEEESLGRGYCSRLSQRVFGFIADALHGRRNSESVTEV